MGLEKGPQIAEPGPFDGEAGRHGMTATLDEDAGIEGQAHRQAEIDAGDRAAGATRLPALLLEAQHDARQVEAVLEARGRKAENPRMPAFAGDDDDGTAAGRAESGIGLAQGVVKNAQFD